MSIEDEFNKASREAVEKTMSMIASMDASSMGECVELHLGALLSALRMMCGDEYVREFLAAMQDELNTPDRALMNTEHFTKVH